MRKVAVVVGIIIFGIFGLAFGNETYENENLKKAGQQALVVRETELKNLSQEIDDYIHKIAEDGKATGKEMLLLEKKVAQFRKKKKKADKYLRIYESATETEIKPEIMKLIDKYTGYIVRYRDKDGKVRRLFASLTGRDIVVESKINGANFTFFLFLCVLFSLFSFIEFVREKKLLSIVALFLGVTSFLILIVG